MWRSHFPSLLLTSLRYALRQLDILDNLGSVISGVGYKAYRALDDGGYRFSISSTINKVSAALWLYITLKTEPPRAVVAPYTSQNPLELCRSSKCAPVPQLDVHFG